MRSYLFVLFAYFLAALQGYMLLDFVDAPARIWVVFWLSVVTGFLLGFTDVTHEGKKVES